MEIPSATLPPLFHGQALQKAHEHQIDVQKWRLKKHLIEDHLQNYFARSVPEAVIDDVAAICVSNGRKPTTLEVDDGNATYSYRYTEVILCSKEYQVPKMGPAATTPNNSIRAVRS
eukprot:CAMPEP_0180662614 /NCGR_PEP_ID=MMETSP1037_2-20121125/59486_1 /TAXON_ID=632150 /ORGANISM="Azadinium spinosum, Strain 3D9" /LENGTH=115 /DNA_ID=CAMNT_0022690289 /DNA_START=352 /DNA_END=700 /DNA_ORIENTATION=+